MFSRNGIEFLGNFYSNRTKHPWYQSYSAKYASNEMLSRKNLNKFIIANIFVTYVIL